MFFKYTLFACLIFCWISIHRAQIEEGSQQFFEHFRKTGLTDTEIQNLANVMEKHEGKDDRRAENVSVLFTLHTGMIFFFSQKNCQIFFQRELCEVLDLGDKSIKFPDSYDREQKVKEWNDLLNGNASLDQQFRFWKEYANTQSKDEMIILVGV